MSIEDEVRSYRGHGRMAERYALNHPWPREEDQ